MIDGKFSCKELQKMSKERREKKLIRRERKVSDIRRGMK